MKQISNKEYEKYQQYHMEAGCPDPGEVFKEDKQVGSGVMHDQIIWQGMK